MAEKRLAFHIADPYYLVKQKGKAFRVPGKRSRILPSLLAAFMTAAAVAAEEPQRLPDLTSHPLAGEKVRIRVRVSDGAGQEAHSRDVETILPRRPFSSPFARRLAVLRKKLALDTGSAPEAAAAMQDMAREYGQVRPRSPGRDALAKIAGALAAAKGEEEVARAVTAMWDAMLLVEEEGLSPAARKLRDAEKALREALQDGASAEQRRTLLEEAQKAVEDFLKEQAEKARSGEQRDENAGRQLEQMRRTMEEMRKATEALSTQNQDFSRDLAQELQRQMQDAMNGATDDGKSREKMQRQMEARKKQIERANRMQKEIDNLQNVIDGQRKLMDDTHAESKTQQDDLKTLSERIENAAQALRRDVRREIDREEARPQEKKNWENRRDLDYMDGDLSKFAEDMKTLRDRDRFLPEEQAGQAIDSLRQMRKNLDRIKGKDEAGKDKDGKPRQEEERDLQKQRQALAKKRAETPQMQELGRRQEGLRERLGKMGKSMANDGIQPPDRLGDAERSMDGAAGKLGQGLPESALQDESRAERALQDALDGMKKDRESLMKPGGGPGPGQGREEDPFGRGPQDGTEELGIDPSGNGNAARTIRDEIRRRLEDGALPAADREYLERLLDGRRPPGAAPR